MKDVAREAGVSVATVSLVFKRSPQISESTRGRVLEVAQRLEYRMSPYIAAHMASRRKGRLPGSSPVMAFVSARRVEGGHEKHPVSARHNLRIHPLDEAYFSGAAARAVQRGYRLERFTVSDPGPSALRLSEILYARNISGILFAPLPEDWRTISFHWHRFSIVALGLSLEEPVVDQVACDGFHSTTTAIERCYGLGYRRPGLVLIGNAATRANRLCLAAYLAMSELSPLALPDWNERLFSAWLKDERPDVIIAPSAGRVAESLERRGRRVPDRVGLVTLDNLPERPLIAGIFQNRELLGSRAVDLLAGAIERNECGVPQFAKTLFIDGVWRTGASVRGEDAAAKTSHRQAAPTDCQGPLPMRELARRLGLPIATVSLGLHNSPLLAEKTRARVLLEAGRLGFRENPFVAKLMAARRNGQLPAERPPLAFVTAFSTRDGWRTKSRTFEQYFEGAKQRVAEKGFQLEETWVPPGDTMGEKISGELRRRDVQGVLLAPLPAAGAGLVLRWEWFCVVGIGFTLQAPAIHRVASDHYGSMRTVVRECFRLGYRRIGLALSATASARVQHRWLASYLEQQRELKGLVPIEPLIAREWTSGTVGRWLKARRPDVIIASSPTVVGNWLAILGYSVPGDIGIAGLNCPVLGGDLSGTHERPELLGARAADILIELIERGQYGICGQPNTLLIDSVWNPGTTVRCEGRGATG